MDIHKPKAAHNLREFLVEIGTIICGILIALGLEQVVEAVHRHELVERAEASLKLNFVRFVEIKGLVDRENACMADRAAEIRRILDRAARSGRLPAVGAIPQPTPHPWEIDTWDAMVASQAAAYLPQERVILYSRVARSASNLYADSTREWGEWSALQSLSGPARPFNPAEQATARDRLAQALGYASIGAVISTNTLSRIEGSGLLKAEEFRNALHRYDDDAHRPALCVPITRSEG